MGFQKTPERQALELRQAIAASKRSQAEAKARNAMHDALQRVMQTTRNEFQLKGTV